MIGPRPLLTCSVSVPAPLLSFTSGRRRRGSAEALGRQYVDSVTCSKVAGWPWRVSLAASMTRSFAQMQASFFSVGSDKHAAVFECCSGKRDSVFVAKFMYVILIHSVAGDGARDEAYLLKEYTPPVLRPNAWRPSFDRLTATDRRRDATRTRRLM